MNYRQPTAFVPHGGGPWPVLPLAPMTAQETSALKSYMQGIAQIPKEVPKTILVVSAHWEETEVTVNTNPSPELLFDYYGFAKEAYELQWPAMANEAQAATVLAALRNGNIPVAENTDRGLDHGVFIPLMLAYPTPCIPIVQISLKSNLDPSDHLEIGKALAPLRDQGVFIIGSGNSYHNLSKFFNADAAALSDANAFDSWLTEALAQDHKSRWRLLKEWQNAPAARRCHPREEHLLPLHVVVGAAGIDPCHTTWRGTSNGLVNQGVHFT